MLTKPAQELNTIELHFFLSVITVIPITEANARIINPKQAMIANGYLMGVSSKIFYHLVRSGKRLFGVHHPVRFVQTADEGFLLW